jgi:WD40 repeat protein
VLVALLLGATLGRWWAHVFGIAAGCLIGFCFLQEEMDRLSLMPLALFIASVGWGFAAGGVLSTLIRGFDQYASRGAGVSTLVAIILGPWMVAVVPSEWIWLSGAFAGPVGAFVGAFWRRKQQAAESCTVAPDQPVPATRPEITQGSGRTSAIWRGCAYAVFSLALLAMCGICWYQESARSLIEIGSLITSRGFPRLVLSPDGQDLVVLPLNKEPYADEIAEVWNTANLAFRGRLTEERPVDSVAVSARHRLLAVASAVYSDCDPSWSRTKADLKATGTITFYGLDTLVQENQMTFDSGVHSIVFSPDDTMLAGVLCKPPAPTTLGGVRAGTAYVTLWDAATLQRHDMLEGNPQLRLEHPPQFVCPQIAFLPDGRLICAGVNDTDGDAYVWVWDGDTGAKLQQFRGASEYCCPLSICPNPDHLFFTGPGRFFLWDLSTGMPVTFPAMIGTTPDHVSTARFSPDGRWFAVGGYWATCPYTGFGGLALFKVPEMTRQKIVRIPERGTMITSIAFSPDGTKLFTASANGIVRVWALPQP